MITTLDSCLKNFIVIANISLIWRKNILLQQTDNLTRPNNCVGVYIQKPTKYFIPSIILAIRKCYI